MQDDALIKLEQKLNQLIRRYHAVVEENASYKAKEASWEEERQRLIEKNDLARTRIEAMIEHLKTFESES